MISRASLSASRRRSRSSNLTRTTASTLAAGGDKQIGEQLRKRHGDTSRNESLEAHPAAGPITDGVQPRLAAACVGLQRSKMTARKKRFRPNRWRVEGQDRSWLPYMRRSWTIAQASVHRWTGARQGRAARDGQSTRRAAALRDAAEPCASQRSHCTLQWCHWPRQPSHSAPASRQVARPNCSARQSSTRQSSTQPRVPVVSQAALCRKVAARGPPTVRSSRPARLEPQRENRAANFSPHESSRGSRQRPGR